MKTGQVVIGGNEPAFPRADGEDGGLTKREYFAALAMQAIIAEGAADSDELAIQAAVKAADLMIQELNK